jgi:transcription initiation factor TFIIF subunit alpha
MTITGLINTFKGRVDKSNTQEFIRLVKAVSSFDKQRSWLTPLPTMPDEEQIQLALRGKKGPPKSAAGSPS